MSDIMGGLWIKSLHRSCPRWGYGSVWSADIGRRMQEEAPWGGPHSRARTRSRTRVGVPAGGVGAPTLGTKNGFAGR